MSLEDDLLAEAKARRERLEHSRRAADSSSELDIVTVPMARAIAIARIEAEEEDQRRTIVSTLAERAAVRDWQWYMHYLAVVGCSFKKPNRWPTIEAIQRAVCQYYGTELGTDLLSQRRSHRIIRPRQVAVYLAKVLTLKSWPEISRRFGGRDHSTGMAAHNRISALMATDAQLAATSPPFAAHWRGTSEIRIFAERLALEFPRSCALMYSNATVSNASIVEWLHLRR